MSSDLLSDEEFEELIQRVRDGDQFAASECVRLFEPEIRRSVRLRLNDPRLRQFVDSIDICQSVFGRFFLRAAQNELDVSNPRQLLGLLVTMARNRLIDIARRQQAQRRNVQRNRSLDDSSMLLRQPEALGPGPASVVAGVEMIAEIKKRLRPDELEIAIRRSEGGSWDEIAAERGERADAVRKRFQRAMDRVRGEFGID